MSDRRVAASTALCSWLARTSCSLTDLVTLRPSPCGQSTTNPHLWMTPQDPHARYPGADETPSIGPRSTESRCVRRRSLAPRRGVWLAQRSTARLASPPVVHRVGGAWSGTFMHKGRRGGPHAGAGPLPAAPARLAPRQAWALALSTHRRVVRQRRASSRSTFPQAPLLIRRGGRVPQEADREAHVPTQQAEASEAARVPPAHAHAGRPSDRQIAAPQGPRPAVGLIGRISDRATFEALRRAGRRARRGPVTVVYAPGPVDVRAAYSVGKGLGTAVQRNRVRRRLRAALRELHTDTGGLPPGAYLVIASPPAARASYAELRRSIASACDAVARGAGR